MNKTIYISSNVLVLIDTWWNVNLDISIFEKKCNTVLIDTWWNVNFI